MFRLKCSKLNPQKLILQRLKKFDFGYFKCAFRGRGGKCTPFCEDGFQIKNANKKIKCTKGKGTDELSWKPAKYNNPCVPLKPSKDACPMPNRVGSSVEILESWEDDPK